MIAVAIVRGGKSAGKRPVRAKKTKTNYKTTGSKQSTSSIQHRGLTGRFLRSTVSAAGREILRPIPRSEFRKAHNLKNAEAKRIYGTHLQKFTAAISADFAAQVAMGKVAKEISVGKSGVRTYKVGEVKAAPVSKQFRPVRRDLESALAQKLGMKVEDLRGMIALTK